MTSPSSPRPVGSPRLVIGRAHETTLEDTRGRVLFPSPEFGAWPPFQQLADTVAVGGPSGDSHAHRGEEVVNYVLSGTLVSIDPAGRRTEVPSGSVVTLATVQERVHDLWPSAGTEARWVSLEVRLPPTTPEATEEYSEGPATSRPGGSPELRWTRVVGPGAAVRSLMGTEISDLTFLGPSEVAVPIGRERRAAVYVVAGTIRVADRKLTLGEGLLATGYATVGIRGEIGSRLIVATVPGPR